MASSLYPGFIKLKYTGATLTHFQILPVQPFDVPTVGDDPDLFRKDAASIKMSVAVDAYVAILKAEVPATVTFVEAEFWYMDDVDADPVWMFTHPLTVVGTNATGTDQLKQRVISFRTSAGGGGFNYLMQIPTNVAVNARQNFPSSNALANATLAYMISAASIIRGRDGGYPVAGNWYTTKYNDANRKKLLDF